MEKPKIARYFKNLSEEKYDEIIFHDNLYRHHIFSRNKEARFYDGLYQNTVINYAFFQMQPLKGKSVLYYGSGTDIRILKTMVYSGANVTAVDISKEAILLLNKCINDNNLNELAIALEMDCESLNFKDSMFDIVFGSAIVHHLNTEKAANEIHRVLKPGGRAVLIEPLGNNPFLNLYRLFTPSSRTKNEHPLRSRDVKILGNVFEKVHKKGFYFLSLLPLALKLFIKESSIINNILFYLSKADELILNHVPILGNYAWCVVVTLNKNKCPES